MIHKLKSGDLSAIVNNGKLVSLKKGDFEYFHGAEKPEELKDDSDRRGWDHSEIVMFPVVGSVRDFYVYEPNYSDPFSMDKHGISRHLPFSELYPQSEDSLWLEQRKLYLGDTLPNPRFEENKDSPENLMWPFDFRIDKVFNLRGDSLRVDFWLNNDSDGEMRYNFGWHPAFRSLGDPEGGEFFVGGKYIPLREVAKISDSEGAVLLKGVSNISYINDTTGREIVLRASGGLENMMLWTPGLDLGMFCIEPVVELPVRGEKQNYFLDKPFKSLKRGGSEIYSIEIHVP